MSTMNRSQGTSSSYLAILALVVIVPLVVLMLLGGGLSEVSRVQIRAQAGAAPAIEWTGLGEYVSIPGGMNVKGHASKHDGQVLDAWKIYTLLLEGQCVASAVFCGPSDIEKLYLCVDPTGRIGGLVVFGNEILTGYQANQRYWTRKVNKPEWEVCRD